MNRLRFKDARLWLTAGAFVLAMVALLVPRLPLQRNAYDVVAIVDITTSMNTRDVPIGSDKVSRLDAAKTALRETVAKLPCGSKLGLGFFTERRSFLLFDPVEVCENFAPVDGAISFLDWRMAWEGDSYVSKGLYSAIDIANSLKADLIFITDGHELPPLPFSGVAPFEGKPGDVGGLIVGIGSHKRSPLLKYDDDGREIGTYAAQDIPQENRSGPPPPDAASRPGYHPKWAPFGNAVVNNKEHLAVVREDYLKQLASLTGLTYAYLESPHDLVQPLSISAHPRDLTVATNVSAVPGALSLALLLLVYAVGVFDRRRPLIQIRQSTRSQGAY